MNMYVYVNVHVYIFMYQYVCIYSKYLYMQIIYNIMCSCLSIYVIKFLLHLFEIIFINLFIYYLL